MIAKPDRPWCWATIDPSDGDDEENQIVVLWPSEKTPLLVHRDFQSSAGGCEVATICRKHFHSMTGIDIRPGNRFRVRFSAEVLDDTTPLASEHEKYCLG